MRHGFCVKDTPPEINRRLFDAMMRKTPAERLLMSLDMMATARELVMQGIQREAGAVSGIEMKRRAFNAFMVRPVLGRASLAGKSFDLNSAAGETPAARSWMRSSRRRGGHARCAGPG